MPWRTAFAVLLCDVSETPRVPSAERSGKPFCDGDAFFRQPGRLSYRPDKASVPWNALDSANDSDSSAQPLLFEGNPPISSVRLSTDPSITIDECWSV